MENMSVSGQGLTPEGRNAFKLSIVGDNLSHLMGKVLTVVDASTTGEQNKAMKDLIRQAFDEKHGWFAELAWKEQEKEGEGHGPHAEWESGIVPCDVSKKYSFR